MSMRGPVKRRPTVQVDGFNFSIELITRFLSKETLTRWCFNVRPTSAKLANIEPTFGECVVFAGKALIVNM